MALRRAGLETYRNLLRNVLAASCSQTLCLSSATVRALSIIPQTHVWLNAVVDFRSSEFKYKQWHPLHTTSILHSAQPAPVEQEESAPEKRFYHTVSADGGVDAQQCDQAIGTLQKTHARVRRSRQVPGYMPLSRRILSYWNMAVGATKSTLIWTAKVPARVFNFYFKKSRAERSEIYKVWWGHAKHELNHYWQGTKLLAMDVKIASRLVFKVLRGKQLSRRERKQLTRTAADVFRLVPFMVFVIIPFMEVLLPVALKLFPNMLPSTFENKLQVEEDLKKRLGAKLEMARFLQDTMEEMAEDMSQSRTGSVQASARELYDFMKQVRSGKNVSANDILKFSKLFNDELTLDNLERVQLVTLCKFVGIQPFGTDAFLRTRLRAHLADIKADDRAIKEEGIDSLTAEELRAACRARGLRASFGELAVPFMKHQLEEWLDLSLNRSLPSSLLLLSRAWLATADAPLGERLKETLSALPDEVIKEAVADKPEFAKRLEKIRREEELIKEEHEAELAIEGLEEKQPTDAVDAQQAKAAAVAAAVVREAAASAVADVLDGVSDEEKAAKAATAKEDKMKKVISALSVLASSSGVSDEREKFMQLVRSEVQRLNKQAGTGGVALVFTAGKVQLDKKEGLQEVVGAQRLSDKVSTILERIEKELDHADSVIGDKLRVLDLDNDGVISMQELHTAMGFLHDTLGDVELQHLLELVSSEGTGDRINVADLMKIARAGSTSNTTSNYS